MKMKKLKDLIMENAVLIGIMILYLAPLKMFVANKTSDVAIAISLGLDIMISIIAIAIILLQAVKEKKSVIITVTIWYIFVGFLCLVIFKDFVGWTQFSGICAGFMGIAAYFLSK